MNIGWYYIYDVTLEEEIPFFAFKTSVFVPLWNLSSCLHGDFVTAPA